MSRFNNKPLAVTSGVQVAVQDKSVVVKGGKGELKFAIPEPVQVKVDGANVIVSTENKNLNGVFVGLTWRTIANMMKGVNEGYQKELELSGVGYRMALKGTSLNLQVGFSHDVNYEIPAGITAVIKQSRIAISGIDKQLVGSVADQIRAVKPAEPYKAKGFRYTDETVRRKAGKSGAK